MSIQNDLLSQNLYHYLNQGSTLNDLSMTTERSVAYFDLSILNLA